MNTFAGAACRRVQTNVFITSLAVVLTASPSGARADTVQPKAPQYNPRLHHRAPTASTPAPATENVEVRSSRAQAVRNRVQNTAAVVTPISREQLTLHHVTGVRDLQNLVPSLTVQPQGATATVNYILRGIGLRDYTAQNTPSVMPYVDGVAYPVGFMLANNLFDMESVEVAAGPTGFTHGQSDTAGEIDMRTVKPTTTPSYGFSEDLASYARSITNLYASGPLSQNVQYRIAGETIQGGGYQTNRYNGESLGSKDLGALRGQLAWQVNDTIRVNLEAHWSENRSEAMGVFNLTDLNPGGSRTADKNILTTGWGYRPQFTSLIGVAEGSKPSLNDQVWGSTVNVDRDFAWATLESTSAFNQMYIHNLLDTDGTNSPTGDTYLENNTSVFSQELSLASIDRDSRLQWKVGTYYSYIATKTGQYWDNTDVTGRGFIFDFHYNQNVQTFTQYANTTYKLLPKLKLDLGVSHESDDRHLSNFVTENLGLATYQFAPRGALANEFAGHVRLDYKPTDDTLLYATFAKSFKPGGFTGSYTLQAAQLIPTKPENLLDFEAGFKSAWLNHKLEFNGDAFYYDYHDQQILGLAVLSDIGPVGRYINVPKTEIWGIETDFAYRLVPGLTLSQHIGYERGVYSDLQTINTTAVYANYAATGHYASFYSSFNGVDAGVPKLTLNGQASYEHPISAGLIGTAEADYSYRDKELDLPGYALLTLPSYFLLNASVTVRPQHGNWRVTAYVENLLDRRYDITREISTDSFYGVPGEPRFVGGRVSYNFQ